MLHCWLRYSLSSGAQLTRHIYPVRKCEKKSPKTFVIIDHEILTHLGKVGVLWEAVCWYMITSCCIELRVSKMFAVFSSLYFFYLLPLYETTARSSSGTMMSQSHITLRKTSLGVACFEVQSFIRDMTGEGCVQEDKEKRNRLQFITRFSEKYT